jgi:hypothetical protein
MREGEKGFAVTGSSDPPEHRPWFQGRVRPIRCANNRSITSYRALIQINAVTREKEDNLTIRLHEAIPVRLTQPRN